MGLDMAAAAGVEDITAAGLGGIGAVIEAGTEAGGGATGAATNSCVSATGAGATGAAATGAGLAATGAGLAAIGAGFAFWVETALGTLTPLLPANVSKYVATGLAFFGPGALLTLNASK